MTKLWALNKNGPNNPNVLKYNQKLAKKPNKKKEMGIFTVGPRSIMARTLFLGISIEQTNS